MKPTYTTSLWEDLHDLAMLCIASGLCLAAMAFAITGNGWLALFLTGTGITINRLVPQRDKNGEPL